MAAGCLRRIRREHKRAARSPRGTRMRFGMLLRYSVRRIGGSTLEFGLMNAKERASSRSRESELRQARAISASRSPIAAMSSATPAQDHRTGNVPSQASVETTRAGNMRPSTPEVVPIWVGKISYRTRKITVDHAANKPRKAQRATEEDQCGCGPKHRDEDIHLNVIAVKHRERHQQLAQHRRPRERAAPRSWVIKYVK